MIFVLICVLFTMLCHVQMLVSTGGMILNDEFGSTGLWYVEVAVVCFKIVFQHFLVRIRKPVQKSIKESRSPNP